MIPHRPPLCLFCKRFDPDSFDPPKCTSFPRGIPGAIFMGQLSHIRSERGELPFEGTIPEGWENLNAGLDEPEVEEVQSKESETARGWTPARRI